MQRAEEMTAGMQMAGSDLDQNLSDHSQGAPAPLQTR